MSFDDRQRQYYMGEINRSIPATDARTIQAALQDVDPQSTGIMTGVTQIMSTFGRDSPAIQRDIACRAIQAPTAGMRGADARVGCGWWLTDSPTIPSSGAYGTRRGPMTPNLATQLGSGRWIWDPVEAQQAEAAKQAARIQSCPDIQYSPFPNMGWCPSTGRAVLSDGAGNPAFPRSPGGDCPDPIITNPANCPVAPPPQPGGGPSPAPAPAPAGISGLCTPVNGALSSGCLQSVATQYCSPNGILAQSLGSGYAGTSTAFNGANAYVAQRGFTLDPGIVNDGRVSVEKALSSIWGLRTLANSGDGSRAAAAAGALCYGSQFDPCALSSTDSGPYTADCVTRAALNAGWAAAGTAMPANGGMGFWNQRRSWADVLSTITALKQAADTPSPSNPQVQLTAIQQVYGTTVNFPKQTCNTHGVLMYRYFFPTWNGALFPQTGPVTHFMGRYILKGGFPDQGSTMQDQTPAGGYLTEGQRMVCMFVPTTTTYQFMIQCDDYVRFMIDDQLYAEVGCCSVWTPTSVADWFVPGRPYKFTIDLWNGGGPWSFGIKMCVGGGSNWVPVPLEQIYMTQDRRLPMLEFAFHKMAPTALTSGQLNGGVPIQDTDAALTQCVIAANIGQVAGRPCMVVDGPGRGVFNYRTYTQGIRLRAIKSFTMMICITGAAAPAGTTPSLVSFFNLPESQTNQSGGGNPRGGWQPSYEQPYGKRVNDFMITANAGTVYPWGLGPLGPTAAKADAYFTEGYQKSMAPYTLGTWFHYAFVWDEDGTGYTIYVNGAQVGRAFMPAYDPQLIMEQFRIGCDTHPEGQSWTGGMQWFRAFDYRLSMDLVKRDMADAWGALY